MNQTETLLRNLRVIIRSEKILARAQIQMASRRVVLAVVAGIAALFALGLFNVAAFFALELEFSPAVSALLLALANLVIAGVVVLVAVNLKPGHDAQMASDFRDMAVSEIEQQVSGVEDSIRRVGAEITDIGGTAMGLVRSPSQLIAPGVAIAAITAITRLLRSSKKGEDKKEE